MTLRVMDEATKKALAGLLPFVPGASMQIVLDCHAHIPPENQPVFNIRDLTPEEFNAYRAAVKLPQGVDLAKKIEFLQGGCLVSWDNLPNYPAFEEIVFSKEAIAKLPQLWIEAIFWKCIELCSPSKVEREVLGFLRPSTSESSSKTAAPAVVPLT